MTKKTMLQVTGLFILLIVVIALEYAVIPRGMK